MRNTIALFVAASCFFFSSCQRPVAYFQPTAHPAASRLSTGKLENQTLVAGTVEADKNVDPQSFAQTDVSALDAPLEDISQTTPASPVLVSRMRHADQTTATRIEHRMQRANTLLASPKTQATEQQPGPKPKKKLKLGNQIRQSLGMKLRPELNWWQRISWKLKASVFVILVAVVFALLHITILAIIFGIVGAFLLISGLKRSFKVRRPWF